MTKRRSFSDMFKHRVAWEAFRGGLHGEKTIKEVASSYNVPVSYVRAWKRQFVTITPQDVYDSVQKEMARMRARDRERHKRRLSSSAIQDLKWARFSEDYSPGTVIQTVKWELTGDGRLVSGTEEKTRGQELGIRFEAKALEKIKEALPPDAEWYPLQWIDFEDRNGHQLAQPDAFFLHPAGRLVLIEIKHAQSPEADRKMRNFYAPLLQHIFPQRRIIRVQCCKRLVREGASVLVGLEALPNLENPEVEHILHLPDL